MRAVWMVGAEAALVAAALGFMYALLVSAPLGAVALPLAMTSMLIGYVVGALAHAGASAFTQRKDEPPAMVLAVMPNASAALIVAAMLWQLQGLPGLRGNLAAAVVAVVAAGLLAGLLQVVLGALRLGSAMKFLPFPVVAGFTNTIAVSMIAGMLPAALGLSSVSSLGAWLRAGTGWHAVQPGALVCTALGTAAGLAVRRWQPRLPAAVVALLVALGAHVLLLQVGPAGLSQHLGATLPIAEQLLPEVPAAADLRAAAAPGSGLWTAVGAAALTLAVLNGLLSLVSATGLGRPSAPPLDSNRLLRTLGVSSMVSALCGGLPTAVASSTSTVLRRAQAPAWALVGACAVGLLLIFIPGHDALRHLPLSAVAAAVFTAASGMFDAWSLGTLRSALLRGRLPAKVRGQLAICLLVTVAGVVAGLAAALFIGLLAAVALLAVDLRGAVVLNSRDGRQLRSRRLRPAAHTRLLDERGAQLRVIELGHFLYFGTVDEVSRLLEAQGPAVRWLVLDLRRVAAIEATAARSLALSAQRLAGRGTQLVLAGLPEGDARRLAFDLFVGPTLQLHTDVDMALEAAENALLGPDENEQDATEIGAAARTLPGLSAAEQAGLNRYLSRVRVRARQRVFSVGDPGDALYFVAVGRCTLWVPQHGTAPLRLMNFGPGALFGEMALLDGHRRSSDAVADTAGELLVLTRPVFDSLALTEPELHAAINRGLMLLLVGRLRDTTRLLQERG